MVVYIYDRTPNPVSSIPVKNTKFIMIKKKQAGNMYKCVLFCREAPEHVYAPFASENNSEGCNFDCVSLCDMKHQRYPK